MQREQIEVIRNRRPSTLSLRDAVAVLFRQRRLLLASFVTILAVVVLSGMLTSTYRSEMKILVRRDRIDPVVTSQPNVAAQIVPVEITESELNSEVELLNSEDLLRNVVMANRLQEKRHFWQSPFGKSEQEPRIAQAVRKLRNNLKSGLLRKTNMIAVTYSSSDPDLSARVLNSVASLYVEKHLQVHRPSGELKFFDQETAQLRQGLDAAEAQVANFTAEHGVVSAQFERDLALQKVSDLEASVTRTQAAMAEAEQRIRTLEQQATSLPPRIVTQLRTADNPQLLQQMKSTRLSLELKRTELLSKFEPTYRPVQELEKQIKETGAAIDGEKSAPVRDETTDLNPSYGWVQSELVKTQAELSGLKARAAADSTSLARYRSGARALQEASIVQQNLLRMAKTEEENYLLYRRKGEEARVNDALDRRGILNVAIAEPPTVPELPAGSFGLYSLLGLCLASTGSVGLAFASDFLDPSFRTPDEVVALMEAPVLASIPKNGR